MPASTQEPFQRIGVDEAKRLIDEGVTLIDVREPREIPQDGKIAGSTLVPLNSFLANPRQHLLPHDYGPSSRLSPEAPRRRELRVLPVALPTARPAARTRERLSSNTKRSVTSTAAPASAPAMWPKSS